MFNWIVFARKQSLLKINKLLQLILPHQDHRPAAQPVFQSPTECRRLSAAMFVTASTAVPDLTICSCHKQQPEVVKPRKSQSFQHCKNYKRSSEETEHHSHWRSVCISAMLKNKMVKYAFLTVSNVNFAISVKTFLVSFQCAILN